MTPLARCLFEQASCKAYLDGPGEDKSGAWMGLCDWLMEETILRAGRDEFADTTQPAPHHREDSACKQIIPH